MARPTTSSRSEATIAEGTTVRGRISGDGSLTVFGTVHGDISLQGELAVGSGATLHSNIEARSVQVDGDVEGTIVAEGGSVRLGKNARLIGDVHAARFSLEEGGEFAGNLAHDFDLPSELGASSTSTSSRRR